jgi:hypothetical protein
MRLIRIAAVALLILVAAAIAGVGRPEAVRSAEGADFGEKRTVTVSGSSFVTAVPDRASFTFGVEGRGTTASEALAESSAAIKRVVDALKDAGVDGDDIQTQQVSLYPVTSDDGRHIEGYAASSSVFVKVENLDRAGPIVDAAVGAGANTVYGPSLERSDADELARDALAAAVADARAKAETLAEAAGGSLGQVLAVAESSASTPMPYDRAFAETAAADVSIEPGRQEFHATVTVTFELGESG